MKNKYNVQVTLLSSGKAFLYSDYLPGNKHAVRKPRLIEDVYREICDEKIPDTRYYLALEVGGTYLGDDKGSDVSMPTIKYNFKKP